MGCSSQHSLSPLNIVEVSVLRQGTVLEVRGLLGCILRLGALFHSDLESKQFSCLKDKEEELNRNRHKKCPQNSVTFLGFEDFTAATVRVLSLSIMFGSVPRPFV